MTRTYSQGSLWVAATGEAIGSALGTRARFNAAGSHVVDWGGSGVRLWDATTGKLDQSVLENQDANSDAILTGDGRRMLTWSSDNTARVWDTDSGMTPGPELVHQDRVEGAVFSRDGSRVLDLD